MDSQKERLIKQYKRRLQLLQEKRAILGIDAPPHLLMEIEDIEAEIVQLGGQGEASKARYFKSQPERVS
ncbi:MAG: hypothetical protein AAF485_23660, partial [Chloroflexota bacterium]